MLNTPSRRGKGNRLRPKLHRLNKERARESAGSTRVFVIDTGESRGETKGNRPKIHRLYIGNGGAVGEVDVREGVMRSGKKRG